MPSASRPIPADVAARMSGMFARMQARGMLETVQIYGNTTTRNGNGKAVARTVTLLATVQAYVEPSGGFSERSQDGGQRKGDVHFIAWIDDGSGVLTEENANERWIVLATRDSRYRRFTMFQCAGPYLQGEVNEGAPNDVTGSAV
jgi:hypothetical protein